jgi:hypothetical protein
VNQKKKLTEAALVGDVSIEDTDGDLSHDSDTITFDGILSISALAVGNDGKHHEIGYSVSISASADYSWETDERPTGWNHRTDSETWTSTSYAALGDIQVHALEFDPEGVCYYNNEEVSAETLLQNLPHSTQKQLLNPTVISNLMDKTFEAELEELEAPSKDDYFNEPDYGEYY